MAAGKPDKIKVTALIDAGVVEWVDKNVEDGPFNNRSHAFELAIKALRRHPELIIETLKD